MSHSLERIIFHFKKQTVKSIKKEPHIQNFLTIIFEYKKYNFIIIKNNFSNQYSYSIATHFI